MKLPYFFRAFIIPGILAIVLIAFPGCNRKKKLHSIDPGFAKYIEAYTSGTISKTSPITIKLAGDASVSHTINEPLKEKLFSMSPSVEGTTVWIDERTVEFRPKADLKPGELYDVEFYLSKVMKVPVEFKVFRFNVKVLEPSFSVKNLGLKVEGNSREKMSYTGEVETADFEDTAKVAQLILAKYQGNPMQLRWLHDEVAHRHTFVINGITRTQAANDLEISWNGTPIHAKEQGSEKVVVPAVGDFKVLNAMAVNEDSNYGLIQFSAPISNAQDLTGLITLSPDPYISYTVIGSEVKIYSEEPLEGSYSLQVVEGVENIWGEKLEKRFSANLVFENRKPSVEIIGKGQILPNSGKVVLPFEAVNLNAVDVSIIRIYEKNIPQFLQVNDLNGESQLRRVGKPVVRKTIRLDNDKSLNLNRRNRFALDIDQLVKTEPGAMYRITIGFRPEYSLYSCDQMDEGDMEGTDEGDDYYDDYYYDDYYYGGSWSDEDDEFWSLYDQYYPYGYDWEERDNPCKPSYYNKEKWESRNIIASNIGLTLKQGSDKTVHVLVTDLLSANPLAGVQLELLDYQQQVITQVTSDNNGQAKIDLKRKPFLLVAKRNKERAYLKLDDGSSLPMSRFDVEGEELKEGIKGFISGERGIWRPGDSLFISFILEDKGNLIPDDHPVEFFLISPKGQVYKKMVTTSGLNGYYVFRTATDPGAPTGNWTAKIKVGGAQFEKRIKIETIMPNRLKINLDFGGITVLGVGESDAVTLSSNWLFGAPGKNLKAKVDATLSRQGTTFDKFKDFVFDDPTVSFSAQSQTVFEGNLDEEGRTDFNLIFDDVANAPGFLRANFLIKVFEPGGAYSVDNVTLPYSPFPSYVGLKVPQGEKPFNYLLTGKNYSVDIVNVDAKGNKLSGQRKVKAELYELQWRWWWDNSGDDISNYATSRYSKLIKSTEVTLSGGAGRWTVAAPEDGYGRYLMIVRDPESGHASGQIVYFDDPYWQTRSRVGEESSATMLSFSSDRQNYKVGDKVKLSIPSSAGGRLFISVETGRRVLKTFWVETQAGQTKFEFTADADMAPNIYVNVSLIQPHAQTVNDLPIRMYGVISVNVEDPNTKLKPVIAMNDVLRPEQNSKVTVSESSGKEMTYTIAIVDEGLLDLTRFKTPDPYSYFYSKEALGVKTWDLYDQVIGAWGGQLERILTIGGDGEYGPDEQTGANRFKPVVLFLGPFHLKRGEKKTHDFKLPPYIGSVRVMVVAGQNNAYGNTEKTVAVKDPLMMLTTLPRVIGPTEQIKIPVTVFAAEKHVKNVTVELQNNPMLEIIGERRKTINFTGIGDQTIYFEARVKPVTGITKIKLLAGSGNEKAVNEVEIEVRNPNPPITKVDAGQVSGSGNWSIDAMPIGVSQNSKAILELSVSPPMNLQKRMNYLVQYPHGCIEQITSSVFPQIVLNDFIEVPEGKKKEIQANVNAGIRKILNQQVSDGGFSYWRGYHKADDWGSTYAGHFLLEAKSRGYQVSDEALQSWIRFQKNRANKWTPTIGTFRTTGEDIAQAYRLYTLALAKSPELGAMNRLKEFPYICAEAKWRLAAAYKLAGYQKIATDMVSGLPTSFPTDKSYIYTFGSDLRDQAMVLETTTILGMKNRSAELIQRIAARMASEEWMSTQTTAYCLVAIAKYNNSNSDKKPRIAATVTVNGKTINVSSGTPVYQLPVDVSKGKVSVKVSNGNASLLYARLITEGQPLPGENVAEGKSTSRLSVKVEYLDFESQSIDVSKLSQGTDFVARVTVNNPGGYGYYNELALSQIFPSGWEIMNTRIWDEQSAFSSSAFEYQDIRDDRVYTYFDLPSNQTRVYYVVLNAAYMGRYYLPMTVCEAMYDNNISATVSGKWVEVVQ